MQTDLSTELETLLRQGRKRAKRRTILLISLGVTIGLIGLAVALWGFREASLKANQAAKLAEAQVEIKRAQAAEQQAKVGEQQVNQLVAKGIQQAHTGHFSAAAQSYDAALKLDPNNTNALQFYGYLQIRQGNTDQAVSLLRHAVSTNPLDPWSRYNFALALYHSGDRDAAIDQLQQLVIFAPEFKQVILSDTQFRQLRRTPQLQKLLGIEDRAF